MSKQQEPDWLKTIQTNPEAFADVYEAYFPRLYNYMCYRVEQRQDAEDLVGEVFLKVVQKLGRFSWRHAKSFDGWLFRIAHNAVADFYRKKGTRKTPLALEQASSVQTNALPPEEMLIQAEGFAQLRHLLTKLSPRKQEVITLKFFGQLRNQEIADILGLDERTVASHLCRGLRALHTDYVQAIVASEFEENHE